MFMVTASEREPGSSVGTDDLSVSDYNEGKAKE